MGSGGHMRDIQTAWAEPLPPGCPPFDAYPPDTDSCYYRLVDTIPPQITDFHSNRMLFPKRHVEDECIARAVSLLGSDGACAISQKFPTLRHKKPLRIVLPPESGLIKKTGNDHWSWWRARGFDIVKYCQGNNLMMGGT